MFLVSLGFRNLLRNRRRTLLSMGSVIAGVAVLIMGRSAIGGLTENIIRAQVDTVSGHVVLRPVDYPSVGLTHPVDELLDMAPELQRWLDERSLKWTRRRKRPQRMRRGRA